VAYIGRSTVRSPRFVLMISIFGGLTTLVILGETSDLDDLVLSSIRMNQGNNTLNATMLILSYFGDTSTLLLLSIVLTIVRRTRRIGVVFLTCIVIILILAMYIKILVGREIPQITITSSRNTTQGQKIEEEIISPMARDLSYPATHIAIAACFAYLLELSMPRRFRYLIPFIWSYPVLMAFPRLHFGQYYLTDVIGGFLLGLIIGMAMSNIMRLKSLRSKSYSNLQ
jgi:undecaprenyl-diphosphatase